MVSLPHSVVSAAYRAQHYSLHLGALAFQRTVRLVMGEAVKVSQQDVATLQRRYAELLQRDLDNVNEGLYPASLLRFPIAEYVRALPLLLRDLPRSYRRAITGNYQDLPNIDLKRYPAYYRRNFHWQTDGYLSRRSAEIYDIGVEFLFGGTADVMRRQVIPPIVRHLQRTSAGRLIDIGCGTGRMIKLLAAALPRLRYVANDLSPYYLQQARDLLADVEDLSLVAENAESLPFQDDYFDVATSVHLFHELPRDARRNVMREALRVVKPGGLFVVQDSMQTTDSESMSVFSSGFAKRFHEPYYKGYLDDDLANALAEVGFDVLSSEPHFVAKVVVGRVPTR